MRHSTGAADVTGFSGYNGFGGRDNCLSFEETFWTRSLVRIHRVDTEDTVRITFTPAAMKPVSANESPEVTEQIGRLIHGDPSDAERNVFFATWHIRVHMILRATPGPDTPFTLEREIHFTDSRRLRLSYGGERRARLTPVKIRPPCARR